MNTISPLIQGGINQKTKLCDDGSYQTLIIDNGTLYLCKSAEEGCLKDIVNITIQKILDKKKDKE